MYEQWQGNEVSCFIRLDHSICAMVLLTRLSNSCCAYRRPFQAPSSKTLLEAAAVQLSESLHLGLHCTRSAQETSRDRNPQACTICLCAAEVLLLGSLRNWP